MTVPVQSLSRGQNVVLDGGHRQLQAVVAWTDRGGDCSVDLSALLLARSGKVRADEDMVFYNQPVSPDGAVRHLGNTTSETGAEAAVAVDLETLTDDVTTVALVASIEHGVFGALEDLRLLLLDGAGSTLARFDIGTATSETALHFGEVYRRQGDWRFRAVGQGWDTGLAGIAADFGITVADDVEPGDEPEPREPAKQQSSSPVADGEVVRQDALVEVVPPPAAEPVPAPVAEGPVATGRPARSGVRTARPRPVRVAPSVLADDDSW